MDEFRTKLYRDLDVAVTNCTIRMNNDEMEEDMDERADGERMSFDNIDNKALVHYWLLYESVALSLSRFLSWVVHVLINLI